LRNILAVTGLIFGLIATSGGPVFAAGSCSSWKSVCETRGPGCDAKFSACMKSGCWTEGKQFGGKTHCGLSKN
jgi:hypothetical protein